MIWLGERRGWLSDWTTQRWVALTGRRLRFAEEPWLDGPVGGTRGIGASYFDELAASKGWKVVDEGAPRGLIPDFEALELDPGDRARLDPRVVAFYERTSEHELDAWSRWCGAFRPLGGLLRLVFSRRLQQLNVPLSPLDSALGMTSRIVQLFEPGSGRPVVTGWVRELVALGSVVYCGAYSTASLPDEERPCVKVVFPLPNGNAVVLMRAAVDADGALVLSSAGRRFGQAGFYFTVHDGRGGGWARRVATMKETIRVHGAGDDLRADHAFRIWGATFLRIHYRLRPAGGMAPQPTARPSPSLSASSGPGRPAGRR